MDFHAGAERRHLDEEKRYISDKHRQGIHYLDPRKDKSNCREWTPITLPPEVREFGYYPDLSLLWPGDLILVSNIEGNFSHRIIEQVQTDLGYDKEKHAIWHHAAVYLGIDGRICEADLDGVRYGSIDRYSTGKHLIKARAAKGLTLDQRWHIALKSLVELNKRYSFEHLWEIFRLTQYRLGRVPTKRPKRSKSAKICSELYEDAFCKVTSQILSGPDDGEITPARLSASTDLSDIKLEWVRIRR